MEVPFETTMQQLLDEFHQQREAMLAAQRKLRSVSGTATAPKRAVKVTVGCQGEITELSFPTQAYRTMAPAELAAAVTETIATARAKAMHAMSELMAPLLPAGVSARDAAAGKVDLASFVPDGLPRSLDELLGGAPASGTASGTGEG
jgi:DNA-binding protein YbaB